MSLKNLKYNIYEGDIFFINKDQKIEGMLYAVVRMNKQQLKGIVECVDLTVAAYPIPRNLRERLENILLPRLYEIKDVLDTDNSLPNNLGIELSKLNQEDIFYGLDSTSIQKLLRERRYEPEDLKNVLSTIQFQQH
ncbi:MAG: hypothetical protein KAX18_02935 [Candidatus Lokiarchaeota archaeon]|nr:hypothetical protein [Candidatus Lokiarchaeota archaeon]